MAWTNRPAFGPNPNFRGPAPHGPAYGYHGQRPAWSHGNAYGRQHHNQWQHRNQWDHRNAYGSHHQGYRQFHNPKHARPTGPYTRYSNAAYQFGPRR